MRRRRYLAAGGTLAAAIAGGTEAIEQQFLGSEVVGVARQTTDGVEIRILKTNDPVEGGGLLAVTVEVENTGSTTVRPEITGIVDGERRSVLRTAIGPGETEVLDHFSYRLRPAERDDNLLVRFEAGGDAAERTVDVLETAELDSARTTPDRELMVRPETPILFEVESDALGAYGGRTHWFVDGAYAGFSMGPWYGAYYEHRDAEYWQTSFESAGTYEVRAAIDGNNENYRAAWTITVAADGFAAPSIDATRPPDGSLEVMSDEPTELEADVSHPDGALDRVVWWLGHSDTVLGESAVGGTEDTARFELEGGCHGCPIVVWVVDENGTVTAEPVWELEAVPDEAGLDMTIVETNDPVDAGEVLAVTAELENSGESAMARDVDLIVGHDPALVDSRSVTLDGGETETVELEFTTAEVRRTQEFPARIETEDRSDETSVTVIGTDDVGFDVTIVETNAPVRTGEFLEVVAELENPHGSGLTRTAQLVGGYDPDVVDAMEVTLEPGASETIAMGYETALVRNDQEFPVRVETQGGADEGLVFVYADEPPLRATIVETNDPVVAGDTLEISVELENVGEAAVTQDVDLIVGHDPERVDSRSVTVGPGDVETVDLRFETATVRRTQTFPARVESEDDADERDVEVIGTDDLDSSVTIVGTNDPVDAGDVLTVTADVENARDGAVTHDLEFVVGHDPTVVDTAVVTVGPGDVETVELAFRTALVENDQEFPVRVESSVDSDERTVLVRGTDGELTVDFVDCTRVEVAGTLEDGAPAFASTGFYDEAGFGNAIIEDGITVGDDVEAPFTGTVIFEIGDESRVADDGDEVLIEIPEYGPHGTVITGITTDPDDYAVAGITHGNPNAGACLDEARPARPTLAVADVTEAGADALEVTFAYENPNEASVGGGAFAAGTTSDGPPAALEPGVRSFTVEWTPESAAERLVWEVPLSAFGYDDPVRTATRPAGEYGVGDPELAVTIVETNTPVDAGDFLQVTATIENVGDGEASRGIALVVGHDPELVDSQSVSIDPGGTETITLGYETPAVRNDQEFPVRVQSEDDADERTVLVYRAGAERTEESAEAEPSAEEPPEAEPDPEETADAEPEAEPEPESEPENETIET